MVEFDIANVLRGIGGRELQGIRHLFFGLGFMWRIPGLVLSGMFLKGGYELGFEERKGCEYVVVYGINLVLFRIFKKSKGHKRKKRM